MGGKLWGCCFVICLLVLPAARALVLHSCGFVHGCHSPLYLLNNEVISTVSWFHSFVKLVVQRGNPCLSNSLTPGSDWHSHSNFIVGKKSLHYPNISTLRRSVRSPMTRQQGFNLWGVQSSPPRRRAAQEGSSTCTPAELPGEEEIRSSPPSHQTDVHPVSWLMKVDGEAKNSPHVLINSWTQFLRIAYLAEWMRFAIWELSNQLCPAQTITQHECWSYSIWESCWSPSLFWQVA